MILWLRYQSFEIFGLFELLCQELETANENNNTNNKYAAAGLLGKLCILRNKNDEKDSITDMMRY